MTERAASGDVPALVGLVVVSHSRSLAHAAVELAGQMVHDGGPRVAVAAGLDDGSLGTDAVAIQAAIEQVDGPAGVVVLMDLGSAVLSAELALDLIDDTDLRDRVLLSPAPLVEGLVAAVVTAAGGASAADVAAEAAGALAAKQSQLGSAPPGAPLDDSARAEQPPAGSSSAEITVTPEHGLHARPVARLVGELRGLDAAVTLTDLSASTGPAPATSPTQVALLGALHGHRLRIDARGPDADEAVRRLLALASRNFDDPPSSSRPAASDRSASSPDPFPATSPSSFDTSVQKRPSRTPESATSASKSEEEVGGGTPGSADAAGTSGTSGTAETNAVLGASPGVAVGPVRHLRVPAPDLTTAPPPSGDVGVEESALRRAIDGTRTTITAVRDATARDVGSGEAAVFDAHLALLVDDALLDDAHDRIRAGAGAATAWAAAVDRVHDQFAALPDPYLSARAADVRAVGDQVLRTLLGTPAPRLEAAGVLVAEDLSPDQAASLDPGRVQAVVLARGSRTSHAAILTRARGIPALVAAGDDVLTLPEGTVVAVDGTAGTLVVRPDAVVVAEHERRAADLQRRLAAARAAAAAPARTRDGTEVQVACNVGSLDDARAGAEAGAEGAGLVRTELCFLGREDEPDVDEQQALYLAIAQALGGQRITLRTLDVGGDKPLPYLPVPHEDNPFLGLRGLRLGLAREPVLRRQLTAVVRVARQTPVSVMFPMVSTVDELRRARAVLDDVLAAEAGRAVPGLQVGIMVEVPATALKLDAFAGLVDFVSIGTNDLTQYALAAERGNPQVAALSDPLDPGVLALVAACGRAARERGPQGRFDVAVCGEAAADEAAVPLLLGLGVGELSVPPGAVPSVKQQVRELDLDECTRLARSALAAASAEDVRDLVRARLG